jgi:Undecaprenyl-phosphate galactose phosphotransferase WbaP
MSAAMRTTFAPDLEADLAALDDLFDEVPQPRRRTVSRVLELPAPVPDDDKLAGSSDEDWAPADSAPSAVAAWRSVRTTAPFILADVLALALSGMIAQIIFRHLFPDAAASVRWVAPFALLPLMAAYWLNGLYSEIWVHPVIEFRQLTTVSTVSLLAASGGGLAALPFPAWCAAAWPASAALVPLCRTIARHLCVNRPWWGYPALVIGSGEGAARLAAMLLDCPRSALRPVLLTDPGGTCRASAMPVINDPSALESLLRAEGIHHAVVSLPEFSTAGLMKMLDRYSGIIPHLLVLSDASTLPTLWGASRSGGRLSGIEVRNGLLMATLQGVKRLLDVVVAAATLGAGLPLLLAIALIIRLGSPGPILFGQTRVGRRGRRFVAWKFRTMHTDADEVLRQYLRRVATAQLEWDRDQKLRRDPRVTWFGRFLRKTSLDELPQLWNVLRGDMSLVGPRPIVESEIRRYADVYRLYTSVKPGITGLWQVSGRSNVSYEDRVRLDAFYVRHWSPWLDIYVLAKTIVVLMTGDGAY